MQTSSQFFNFYDKYFTVDFISRILVNAYKKLELQQLYFCKASNPAQKPISSQLRIAANLRPGPRFCGKAEGSWSLLSRAEAQVHLYVTAIQSSCFLQPVTCNREEAVSYTHLTLPTIYSV